MPVPMVVETPQLSYPGQLITFATDTPALDGVEIAGRSFAVTKAARDVGTGRCTATIDEVGPAAT